MLVVNQDPLMMIRQIAGIPRGNGILQIICNCLLAIMAMIFGNSYMPLHHCTNAAHGGLFLLRVANGMWYVVCGNGNQIIWYAIGVLVLLCMVWHAICNHMVFRVRHCIICWNDKGLLQHQFIRLSRLATY